MKSASGTDLTKFSPNTVVTRAMVVTFLFRMKHVIEGGEHLFTLQGEQPATCTLPPSQIYACECGNTKTVYSGEALGHEFYKATLVADATASTPTVYQLTCLRCGAADAWVGADLVPTQRQGSAGSVTPTGWINVKYEIVPGGYVYNRCHLIGYQLTGENANRRNLITGTRYMNVEGMLPFEDAVADYVKATGNHVLYRVTPVFVEDELVARGVLMEALSMEDGGDGICFCVFCYNVQPGVVIDYATGISRLASSGPEGRVYTVVLAVRFIANTNTMKYHLPECTYAASMSPRNRAEMTAMPVQMAEAGYSPCSRCRPDESAQTVTYRYGDADADGDVTPGDARMVLRFAVELDAFTDWQRVIADVDGDDRITPADARKVLRAAVGLGTI